MKDNLHIDEEIVAALNFSNLVLLDQCLHQLNYPLINPKSAPTKKQKQHNNKSKFEKVNKNKQKIQSNQSNVFDNVTLGSTKKHSFNDNQVYSKVKICTDQIDIFSQASFNYNNNIYNNNNKANHIYTPQLSKTQQYTVNDFLNQTAISSSSKNKFSPINAWKTSSVEKYHPNNFLIQAQSSQQFNFSKHLSTKNNGFFTDHSVKDSSKSMEKQKRTSSSTKSVTKKGKKYQKFPSSSKKTTTDKKIQPQTQTKPHIMHSHNNDTKALTIITKIHQHKKQQQLFFQHSLIANQQQQKSFYDNQTRDTCQLAPSKLQKLIEVEDNKYKQMVLKTFYKHQK